MVSVDEDPAAPSARSGPASAEERIRILLPVDQGTLAQLLMAVAQAFPGAEVEHPSAEERERHGDLLVLRVAQP